MLGKKSSNFESNLKLAKSCMNGWKKYPGLSRGVISKGAAGDNGIYNQDLNERSVLIEFGGVDNNREELERAAEAMADVFSEMYWNAEKLMQTPVKTIRKTIEAGDRSGFFMGNAYWLALSCFRRSSRHAAGEQRND
ncbi:stage II sporulation protein P [Bacillus licheniformis]|nr:stage II sporulation protein P [Bacillus licheniformis]